MIIMMIIFGLWQPLTGWISHYVSGTTASYNYREDVECYNCLELRFMNPSEAAVGISLT